MLFFKLSSSFHFVFLHPYLSLTKLSKIFGSFCSKSISKRFPTDEHEVDCTEQNVECIDKEDWESADDGSQSEIHEEDLGFITFECSRKGDLVSDTISKEETLLPLPLPFQSPPEDQVLVRKGIHLGQSFYEEPPGIMAENIFSRHSTTVENILVTDSDGTLVDEDNARSEDTDKHDRDEPSSVDNMDSFEEGHTDVKTDNLNVVKNFLDDDANFFSFTPLKFERKSLGPVESRTEEAFEYSFSVGSTSKSSSEPRTSLRHRDSVSEDPFSSSSRRSCPTWESFTAFQKYDEEMFCNQNSPPKLNQTKLHRTVDALPRSMSQKIVQKLTKRNRKPREFRRSPYHEVETAYVAQVCLAWEALSLNYKNFLQLRALECDEDPGYPAYVAQQFQQFQVLLRRFIENEPFEHGRRPEIYARIKMSSPKLLQVPEFRGVEKTEYNHQDGWNANISSVKFMAIMEDGIQTFMDFLKRDKEKHFQILKAFVSRNNRTSLADPTLLHMLERANKKKKKKIKDMGRVRKCLRKTRPRDEEMEILMGLVDLKVVSRVLKLSEISEELLQWCEAKMSKVRFWEGKLQRDSSPLPFPVHPLA